MGRPVFSANARIAADTALTVFEAYSMSRNQTNLAAGLATLTERVAALSLSDFCLSADRAFQQNTIEYFHVDKSPHVSIGIFLIAKGCELPLHNHPTMTVLSKVIHGGMTAKVFTPVRDETPIPTRDDVESYVEKVLPQLLWTDSPGIQEMPPARKNIPPSLPFRYTNKKLSAILSAFGRVTAEDPARVLSPSSCNIHQFIADSDCALLDIIGPPYSASEGRSCTYYHEVACDGQGNSELLEGDPYELEIGPFSGQQVVG